MRYINKLVNAGKIKGVQPSLARMKCSREKFVDDTIFMGEAMVKEDSNMKKALMTYNNATGQLIKWEKISVYFSNTLEVRQRKISPIIGYKIGTFPTSYIGIPLCLKLDDSF